MDKQITILGFAGSLRKGSYNKTLMRAAVELSREDAKLEIFDLEGIPPYNMDLEDRMPEKVIEFKEKIRRASRPSGDNSFNGKPVAIMSASPGMLGGARMQYHLRQIFVFLNTYPVNKPEVFVTFAAEKIDDMGKVRDEKTREKIKELLVSLIAWTRKLKGG